MNRAIYVVCACGAALAPHVLNAQSDLPPAPSAVSAGTVYEPVDFARFAPRTALDMVSQIPGFAIEAADERRGLGQGGDNILINGRRFSGKANDAVTALIRIPAADVARIEVVDAASLDIPGLSGRVANIITADSTPDLSGSFAWRPEFRLRLTDPALLNGEMSLSGSTGRLSYTLGLRNQHARTGARGIERVFDPAGNLVDERDEYVLFDDDRPRISGALRYNAPDGAIANLNLSYEWYRFRAIEESPRVFPEPAPGHRILRERENEWNYEIGSDYEFGVGPGRLKLIGLRRFDHSPYESTVVTDYLGAIPAVGSRFARTSDQEESILRGEYGWSGGGADWQVNAEGALNTLDNVSQLFILGPRGDFDEIPLPGGTATVKEWRTEGNVTYGRPLAPDLTLQASLGAEYSRIGQTGAGGITRQFVRPKGFLSVAYAASPRLDFRGRVEREVGQLNFLDFLASVNLNAGNANAANPNLVPPQSWNVEAEATRNLGDFGTITARAYARFISDIVDQIPIGLTGEAPGNLDDAIVYGLDWTSTFNFDPIGWRGARLDARLRLQHSRLTDPLTGEVRQITRNMRRSVDVDFRHDIPGTQWAWGMEVDQYRQSLGIRLDEVQYFVNDPAFIGIYAEHKDVFGLTVRGIVRNLHGAKERLTRTVFVDRRDGPPAFTEVRARGFGPIFAFAVTGSF